MQRIWDSFERSIVKLRRKRLANRLFEANDGTIQRGHFQGLKLTGNANISKGAHGLKIFGLYETPVINVLASWSPAKLLLNIGAGDGYYSVGMLHSGMVQRSICFESTAEGRSSVSDNARLNGVDSKIEIHGTANAETLKTVLKTVNYDPSDTIVLSDIEGGEFELFDDQVLEILAGSKILVEVHRNDKTPDAVSEMDSRFKRQFETTYITDEARNWQGIQPLESLHGIDCSLVTSEGRKGLGEWLIAAPDQDSLPKPARNAA